MKKDKHRKSDSVFISHWAFHHENKKVRWGVVHYVISRVSSSMHLKGDTGVPWSSVTDQVHYCLEVPKGLELLQLLKWKGCGRQMSTQN